MLPLCGWANKRNVSVHLASSDMALDWLHRPTQHRPMPRIWLPAQCSRLPLPHPLWCTHPSPAMAFSMATRAWDDPQPSLPNNHHSRYRPPSTKPSAISRRKPTSLTWSKRLKIIFMSS
nr:uncharacterized protein LOC6635456 isoform X4 [Drosophila virilis]